MIVSKSVLLLGPTGAGKTPLGEAIAKCGLFGRRCHHLDFGSELRGAVSGGSLSAPYSPAELKFIRGVLEQGLLLENEHFALAEKIISLFLKRVFFSGQDLLVLNGIPRHTGQARGMERFARVLALIVLDCTAADVSLRIRNNVGGDRTEREDDDADLVDNKLRIYRARTAPLVNYYQEKGCSIIRVNVTGTMTPEDAYQELSALTAVDPPVSLITEPPE